MEIPRRSVLVAGLGVLATACSGHSSDASAPAGWVAPSRIGIGSYPADPTTARSDPTATGLPSVTLWVPGPGELVPACKVAAVRRVEAGGSGGQTALQVIDAQYGGLLADSASVLVVTRSWSTATGRLTTGGHTYDVRLSRAGASWRVTAVNPSRPGAPATHLTPAARRVLAEDRITLPPAAAADIRSGRVHDSVLTALLTVARTHRPHVSVVRTGHPLHVFGTTRLSDHPQGRAFDTWAIDGQSVVDPRTPRTPVEDYMHAVAAAGSYNVGGPYLLGAAPQWFSDDTHHDHVHAGFTT
ncbi:hypothetical protein [Nocardioides cynanchi]|uniref:hypothetical protein n=1 Tax=Nocardioides cynanchi TaxID=2558918 RepID=UPI001EE2C2E0|nr:hypothetical protein [Nocardioides cynanchi]